MRRQTLDQVWRLVMAEDLPLELLAKMAEVRDLLLDGALSGVFRQTRVDDHARPADHVHVADQEWLLLAAQADVGSGVTLLVVVQRQHGSSVNHRLRHSAVARWFLAALRPSRVLPGEMSSASRGERRSSGSFARSG